MAEETILIQTFSNEENESTNIDWTNIDVQTFDSSGLDGIQIVNHIVPLLSTTIPIIAGIIIQQIRARKNIKIIDRGTEVHGVSEDKVVEILETIYKHRKQEDE